MAGKANRNPFSGGSTFTKNTAEDLRPPHDENVEKALLGAILINPTAVYEISDTVRPASFYVPKHEYIFDAMLDLYKKGEPVDIVSVSTKLKDLKRLESIGGSSYLSELTQAASSPGSVGHYSKIVQSKYLLRALRNASYTLSSLSLDEIRPIEEVLNDAEAEIFKVANAPSLRKFTVIRDELNEAWERLEHLQKHETALRGISTGFNSLDNMLSGFQKSDLIILAARPSMGKTALALDIARNTAIKHGTSVGIFSLEMSSQQLTDRMLAAESRVDSWKLRTGKIRKSEDYALLQEGISRLSEAPIYIDDQPGNTILSIRSVARRLKLEKNLGLVVVDYLQLITPGESRTGDSLVQQVTELSRGLKAMARELDTPVLALSQLSRAVEQRRGRPRLSDLRDSGSIEQDADVVMFIHREDMMGTRGDGEKNNVAEILIEKHRNGPVGKVELMFDPEKTSFLEVEKNNWDFTEATKLDDNPF